MTGSSMTTNTTVHNIPKRTGKAALVTGASAGIGRDYAHLFAADGHDLLLVARRRDRLEQLAATLRANHGVEVLVIPADLTDPTAPTQIFAAAQSREVEFLLNNAGYGSNGAFVEQDRKRELDMLRVNVGALVELTHLFLPAMLRRGRGRILNLGSVAGFQAGPLMATYFASKAFVNHFSEALWHELDGTGVSVTVSCPGPVATEFAGIAGSDRSNLFRRGADKSTLIAAEGYRAMQKGRRLVVHGAKHRLLLQLLRLAPRSVAHKIFAWFNKPAGRDIPHRQPSEGN